MSLNTYIEQIGKTVEHIQSTHERGVLGNLERNVEFNARISLLIDLAIEDLQISTDDFYKIEAEIVKARLLVEDLIY